MSGTPENLVDLRMDELMFQHISQSRLSGINEQEENENHGFRGYARIRANAAICRIRVNQRNPRLHFMGL
jgi:hypothetical protein